jgi:purine catabolism regulator
MLTVSETLEMDVLRGAVVVAGGSGLKHAVSWVHVAGVPDAPNWLNGGELVLTTPFNMPTESSEQQAYIKAMAEKGVAALIVAVGRYLEETPPIMRQTAAKHGFPLIEIPFQARFVDIARAINERISQENMALTRRALDINRRLTQLVLDGGNLEDLAVTLAGLVGQSISIENERFEILASQNIADVDEARRYTLDQGRTNPDLVAALEAHGALGEIRRTLRPVALPQMPEVGLEMERILAPIVVQGEIYGYMWIIADDRPLQDLDRMAIESGATIAAVIMLYQEAAQNAEATLKGGLLTQLIQSEGMHESGREAALIDQALRYGVNLDMPFAVLLIEPSGNGAEGKLISLKRRLNRLATSFHWNAVIGDYVGRIVILTNTPNAPAIGEQIHASASHDGAFAELRIAISAALRGASQVSAAYQQSHDALYIAGRMGDTRATILFDDLGFLHTLYRAGAGSLETNPHVAPVRLLLAEQGADLFNTLETYVDAGGNSVRTADLLMIHRSTLNYRLERISNVCTVDLGDPMIRANLQVAIKLVRLFGDH